MAGRWKAAAAAAMAAVALAGCGGSDSQAQVKATVTTYLQALAHYDGAGACAKLSKTARAPFDRFGRGQTCASLMTAEARQQIVGTAKQRLEAAKVLKVTVAGRNATATVSVPGRQSTISLVDEHGGWRIENAAGT